VENFFFSLVVAGGTQTCDHAINSQVLTHTHTHLHTHMHTHTYTHWYNTPVGLVHQWQTLTPTREDNQLWENYRHVGSYNSTSHGCLPSVAVTLMITDTSSLLWCSVGLHLKALLLILLPDMALARFLSKPFITCWCYKFSCVHVCVFEYVNMFVFVYEGRTVQLYTHSQALIRPGIMMV